MKSHRLDDPSITFVGQTRAAMIEAIGAVLAGITTEDPQDDYRPYELRVVMDDR